MVRVSISPSRLKHSIPDERIVVVRNRAAFVSRYGNSVRIAEQDNVPEGTGVYSGGLSNGGESLLLVAASGANIKQFTYGDSGDLA